MELVTDNDRTEIAAAKSMMDDGRKIVRRVQARIRKRRQRAVEAMVKNKFDGSEQGEGA